MIANQTIGRSFIGVLKYAFKKDDATFAFSNLANGADNINGMASELIAVSSQRPNLTRSVAHIQFSPNPDDEISDEEFIEYIKAWLDEMGYKDCLYTVAFHEDTAIKHAHVITSRVTLNNEVVSDSNSYAKNLKVSRDLEKTFNLVQTVYQGNDSAPKSQKDKIIKPHDYIKESIKAVGSSAPSMTDFIKSMKGLGIDVELKISSKANIAQGISFKYENYSVTGSKVGYSIKNLEKKLGVKYEQPSRNSGVFSKGISEDKARESATISKITERIEAEKRAANEPTVSIVQRVTRRVKSSVDKLRNTVREMRRDDRELSRVVDQFETNNKLFGKIIEVLESVKSVDMDKKRALFRELKSNSGKDNDIDMTLN